MTKRHELAGKKIGKWTVLEYIGDSRWRVRCDCGAIEDRDAWSLEHGQTFGCRKCRRPRNELIYTPEYHVWSDMFQRCYNPKERQFKNYGARGIRVCKRWSGKGGFMRFYNDMGQRPVKGYQLDRIDNNGDYSPENCRWASSKENNRNRGNNRLIKIDDEEKCLSEWCEHFGKKVSCVTGRLERGWSIEDALKKPVNEKVWANRQKIYLGVEE